MNTTDNRPTPIQWSQQVERLLGELTTMHIGATAGRAEMTELAVQTACYFLSQVKDVPPDCASVFIAASPGKVQVGRGSFPSAHSAVTDLADSCLSALTSFLSPQAVSSRDILARPSPTFAGTMVSEQWETVSVCLHDTFVTHVTLENLQDLQPLVQRERALVQQLLRQLLPNLLAPDVDANAGCASCGAQAPRSEAVNYSCDDPITLTEAAVLIQQTKKTLHNLAGERGDRPCSVYKRKSGEMVWSYQAMRGWILSIWPHKETWLPKDYATATALIAQSSNASHPKFKTVEEDDV